MAISPIPNTRQRKSIWAGTEATRRTAVAPTYKWYGDLQITRRDPLTKADEYNGTYDGGTTPLFGPPEIDGTYATPLSFQDLCILPRYWIAGDTASTTGTSDGNPTPGFTYTYDPTASTDDLDTATLVYGFEGVLYRSTMALFNEVTIRGNVDDGANAQWMWDGRLFVASKDLQLGVAETTISATAPSGGVTTITPTGGGLVASGLVGQYAEILSGPGASQVALITANTTTVITFDRLLDPAPTTSSTFAVSADPPTGVSDRTRDAIDMANTRLWISEAADAITDREVVGRFKAFSVTLGNAINPKRIAGDGNQYAAKIDRGRRDISAQITMEFDDFREVVRFEGHTQRRVRIANVLGPIIDASVPSRMTAAIELPELYWETIPEETRNNNILATYQGQGFVDSVAGYSLRTIAKSTLATLP